MRKLQSLYGKVAPGSTLLLVFVLCAQILGQTIERLPDHHPKSQIDPGLAYSLSANPRRTVVLPRLTRFPDPAVMKAVNYDLSAEEQNLNAKRSDCFAGHEREASWEQTSRVAVLTRDVLSIESGAFADCGGTHPFEIYDPLTYNMRTGKRFDFDRDAGVLFNTGTFPIKDLIEIYKRHYPSSNAECQKSLIATNSLYLHFEPTGLAILPGLPHVIAACGPVITVPYHEIQPLLKPGNPFKGLIGP